MKKVPKMNRGGFKIYSLAAVPTFQQLELKEKPDELTYIDDR